MHDCHSHQAKTFDKLLWGSAGSIVFLYLYHLVYSSSAASHAWLDRFAHGIFDIVNTVWWGLLLGVFMVSLLARIPREIVMAILGTRRGKAGILRAATAGVLLDLCSHGILMVGARLYERGASLGQVMAFLVASPWNSFSLTLILIAMIGLPLTLLFILMSLIIAIVTGFVFDALVKSGRLPENPANQDFENSPGSPVDFSGFWQSLRIRPGNLLAIFRDGVSESAMIMRWILLGIVLASLLRSLFSVADFAGWFGPDLAGLGLTLLAATIIEVCSEGSAPIGADLVNRANAPGNGFAFLMAGVATDYTEIMVIRETTQSWGIALLLPLVTLPQIILLAWIINLMAGSN